MDRIVTFQFGSQILQVYIDDAPEDATPSELRDEAIDIFIMNSHYYVEEA